MKALGEKISVSTHKHKVGKERPPIWAAVISGLPLTCPACCTSTHTLTHMLILTHTHTHTHTLTLYLKSTAVSLTLSESLEFRC